MRDSFVCAEDVNDLRSNPSMYKSKLNEPWINEFNELLAKCDPWSSCLKVEQDFNKVKGWKWKILTYGLKISLLDYGGYDEKNFRTRQGS